MLFKNFKKVTSCLAAAALFSTSSLSLTQSAYAAEKDGLCDNGPDSLHSDKEYKETLKLITDTLTDEIHDQIHRIAARYITELDSDRTKKVLKPAYSAQIKDRAVDYADKAFDTPDEKHAIATDLVKKTMDDLLEPKIKLDPDCIYVDDLKRAQ
jgi:hypothetical protein